MKNKIIASLMAAALFVGMAVPAFADRTGSSLLGDTESVTKITAKKASYTIKNGKTENMRNEVYVLTSNSQLADDSNVSFELEDNKELAFAIDDKGVVTAIEDKGTATVVVKSLDNEKATAKIKVVASKADKVIGASSFKFKASQYTLGTNNAAEDLLAAYDEELVLISQPAGSKFDQDQVDEILAVLIAEDDVFDAATMTGNDKMDTTTAVLQENDTEILITFKAADLLKVKLGSKVVKDAVGNFSGNTNTAFQTFNLTVPSFTNANSSTTVPTKKSATTKIRTLPAKRANVVGANGTLTLKVGDTYELKKNINQGPSTATENDTIAYGVEYYNTDAETTDYVAFVDDTAANEIIGVHTGKVKITATMANTAEKVATFIVNVVDNNAKTGAEVVDGDVTLVNSTASTTVGATGFKMAIKNAPADATVTYSSLNDAVAKVSVDGVVTGVAAGTTQIVADVDGVKLYCTVTVNAGTAEKPGPGVPQTGIVTLVALF